MKAFTIEDVKKYIEENDINHECELLSTKYKNSRTPLLLQCNLCGKIFQRDFNHIKRNRFRCVECAHEITTEKRRGQFKYSIDFIKKEMAKEGYTMIGEYVNCQEPVLCKCSNGHYFNFRYLNYKKGQSRCPYCKSAKELETRDYNSVWARVTLHNFLREQLKHWKNECLKNTNYLCDIDGKTSNNLEVHHLKNFQEIMFETLNELHLPFKENCSEYTGEELVQIKKLFQEKHTLDIGVVISKKYHDLFHQIYGKKNNTKEQYEKFKYLMQNNLL